MRGEMPMRKAPGDLHTGRERSPEAWASHAFFSSMGLPRLADSPSPGLLETGR
jgi:hypothetical protein